MKNAKKVATMLLVAAVAVGSYFVSGTYAKYTTSLAGDGVATVAKWAWDYNGTALTKNDSTIAFNLFDTVKDSDGTSNETDVLTGRIAPGTSGSFSFDFQNKSEVNAKYSLTLAVTKGSAVTNAKIQYSLVGGDSATDWTENLATLANQSEVTIAMNSPKVEKTIYWRWVYEDGANDEAIAAQDAIDTQVGFDAGTAANDADKQITVTATVTFTQVD